MKMTIFMLAFFCLSVATGQGEMYDRNSSILKTCVWVIFLFLEPAKPFLYIIVIGIYFV